MSTFDWPIGIKAFWPANVRWRALVNQRSTVSALSGYTQTGSAPGARWGLTLDMPAQTFAERRALKAFIDRLEGNKHRVGMYDPAHVAPAGNLALGGVTIKTAAAQFATTVDLAGCRAARNYQINSGFEMDTNSDGLSDGLSIDAAGSTGAITYGRGVGHGSPNMQQIAAAALAAGATLGARFDNRCIGPFAGQPVTCSIDVYGTGAASLLMELVWFDSAGVFISLDAATVAMPSDWTRRSVTFTAPAGAAQVRFAVYLAGGAGGLAYANLDNAQVEIAAAGTPYTGPGTLLAGDWLGLVYGQLVTVVADAVADDAGTIQVQVRQPLRAALAAASAVTLDRPRIPMVLQLPGGETPQIPFDGSNLAPAFSIDLVEAWA